MSRVVELIKRFVAEVGRKPTSVESIRLFNNPRVEGGQTSVSLRVSFAGGAFDKSFYRSLLSGGIYVHDTFTIYRPGDESGSPVNPDQISPDGDIEVVEIRFSHEKRPVTPDAITKTLQRETIFGLPLILYKNCEISRLNIYFGANKDPIRPVKESRQQVRSYDSHPYLVETVKGYSVEFIFLDERSNLVSLRRDIADYLSEDVRLNLERHAYTSKSGLRITSLFPSSYFSSAVPLGGWSFLRDQCDAVVGQDLKNHTNLQVHRITRRIDEVQRRRRVVMGGVDLGLTPINEVETVLLFQKISFCCPDLLPGGLKVSMLDYSPKDIDSICRFQLSPNHPEETGPVEFEFSLASFFKHGHDYRQVKLIVCYTISPLVFPFAHGGLSYTLDKSQKLARLTSTSDQTSIPCLIIEDFLK